MDIITARFSRDNKRTTKPTAFIVVKQKQGDGPWTKVGQTDSIPHSSEPKFSKPVRIAYLGPTVAQQVQVEVFSHAAGARSGVPLGDCSLLLDDLVHARASRVMKLPLASPDRAHTNGVVVINATVAHAAGDGLWMQLQLAAAAVPRVRVAACGLALPSSFFEIWRQSADGLVLVPSPPTPPPHSLAAGSAGRARV